MEYTLDDLSPVLDDPIALARWMSDQNFLKLDDVPCRACDIELHIELFKNRLDGVVLRCPNSHCRSYLSVRTDAYFQPSKLPLGKQMQLLLLFVADSTNKAAIALTGVDEKTVINFFDNYRGKWMDCIINNPIKFQDNGEYEVDELILKHVWDSEHDIMLPIIWIQGILERATGKIVLYRIPDRTIASMTNTVRELIPAGSYIYTDEHASYRCLSTFDDKPYVHFAVNHSADEWVRKETLDNGSELHVSTNTIEGMFNTVRSRFAYRARRNLERVDLILHEFMYRHSGRSLFEPFKIQNE